MRIIAGKLRGRQIQAPPGMQTRPMPDRVRQAVFNIIGAACGDPGSVPPVAVLDVFAGSGALGIEALSRGAAYCCFVEEDPAAVRTLKGNLKTLGLEPQARVVQGSALAVRVPSPPPGRPPEESSGQAQGKTGAQRATPLPFAADPGDKYIRTRPGQEVSPAHAQDAGAAPGTYGLVFLDPPYALSRDSSPGGPIGHLLASLPAHADLVPSVLVVLRHEVNVRYDQHAYGRFKAFDVRQYGGMAVTLMEQMRIPA
jgi:16S rRNA (guanine966-N2)-methyltransferase